MKYNEMSKDFLIEIINSQDRVIESYKEDNKELEMAIKSSTSLKNKKTLALNWNIFPESIPEINQQIVILTEKSSFDFLGYNFMYVTVSEIDIGPGDEEEDVPADTDETFIIFNNGLSIVSSQKEYWMDSLIFQKTLQSFMES